MLIQFLINGLINGLLISLAALGFALVYNTTRIFHIAYASIFVVAAYIFWQVSVVFEFPVLIGIITSICITAIISFAIERLVYFQFFKRNATLNVVLVSSIGVFTILTNLIAIIWGNDTKTFSSEIGEVVTLGNIIITNKQILQFSVSIVLILIFFLLLNRSRIGLLIKAVRDDSELFQILGFSLSKIRSVVFILSGGIISIASCLVVWDIGMDPYIGMSMLLNVIVAIIIGGIGRFESCIIGGIFIGILQSLVVWLWSSQWQEAITFLILIIFLFIRSQGFIGEKSRIV